MAINLLRAAAVLVGTFASTDFQILHQYSSFLSDGSTTEGVGFYTVALTPEYLGQDSPIDDYSLSLWYKLNQVPVLDPIVQITNSSWAEDCCVSYDANMMLSHSSATKLTHTSSLWSYVGTTFTASTSLTVTSDLTWHYAGLTHCISNRNLLLCRDGVCSNSIYKQRDPLMTSMSVYVGKTRPNTYFQGRVGDMVLTINRCMSLLDFTTRQTAKVPLSCAIVPGYGGQFLDACDGNSALLVSTALSGDTDYTVTPGYSMKMNDERFFYGRTLSTTFLYFTGWAQSTPQLKITLTNGKILELGNSVIWTEPPAAAATSPPTFKCSSAGFVVWELDSSGANTIVKLTCPGIAAASAVISFLVTGIDEITVLGPKMLNFRIYAPGVVTFPTVVLSNMALINLAPASFGGNCVYTDSACSACLNGYFYFKQRCIKCHWACQICSGPGNAACSLCSTGFYSQPGNGNLCLPQCPTGYTPTASQTCTLSSNADIDVLFDNNLSGDITLPSGLHVQLGWDPNRFYPDFDFLDPIPVRYRGVFYNVSESISLPNYSGNSNKLVLSTDFTVDMWVLPYSYGSLFRVNTNNGWEDDDLVVFGIGQTYINWPLPDMQNLLSFGMKTYGQSFTFYNTDLVLSGMKTEWYHLGFICKYDSTAKTTTVTVFRNTNTFTLSFPSFFVDTATARHNIGFLCRYIAGYLGYIYEFRISNYAKSMLAITALRGKSCTGCPVCPLNPDKCLSICKFTEYVETDGSCKPCMKKCKYGCQSPDSCNLCNDPLCSRCRTFDAGTCILCYPGASFVDGLCKCDPGKYLMGEKCSEQCDPGYFLDTTKASCQPCESGCAECTAASCTRCAPDLFLENGKCSCGEGWYVGDNSDCIRCDAVCKRCEGSPSVCTECYTEYGYYLLNGQCKDCREAPGYVGALGKAKVVTAGKSLEETLNAVCQEKCGDGIMKGQLECDDGNTKDGDGCSSTCKIEHGWDCKNLPGLPSGCKDDKPPEALLTYSRLTSTGYELVFSFTETVTFLTELNSLASVSIANTALFTAKFEKIENPGDLFTPYLLVVEASQSIRAGTRLSVTIRDTSQVHDLVNNVLVTRKVSVALKDGFLTSSSQGIATAVSGLGGAVGGLVGLALVTSLFGGANLGVMWMLLECLQIINYIVYMSVDFPDNLRTFLHMLQFANFNFIPNFFEMFSEDTFAKPPKAFEAEDVSTDFFQNCGQIFTIWGSLGLLYCIITTLSRLFPQSKRLLKWKRNFYYSIPLRFGIESFLELSLAVFLQIRNPIPGAISGYFSVVSAFIVLAYLTLVYYITIGKVTFQSITRLREKRHKRLFGTLYSEFRLERRLTRSFLVLQNLRRLLYVLCLVFITDSPIPQSALIALLTFGFCLSLFFLHPYKKLWITNRKEIACEFVIFLAMCLIAGFNADMSRTSRNALGWVVIGFLSTAIALHFAATLAMQYKDFVELLKSCSKKMVKKTAERQRRKVLGRAEDARVWPFDDDKRHEGLGIQSIGKSIPEMPMLPGDFSKPRKSPSDSPPEEDSGDIRIADS